MTRSILICAAFALYATEAHARGVYGDGSLAGVGLVVGLFFVCLAVSLVKRYVRQRLGLPVPPVKKPKYSGSAKRRR